MKFLQLFLFLILATGCQTTQISKVAIYYVPFQLASNEAITPDNIKEKSNSIEITDKRTLVSFDKLLAGAKEGTKFDRKRVRFLLVLTPSGRSIFADTDGNLLEGASERHMDQNKFDQLQALVSTAVSTGGEMR